MDRKGRIEQEINKTLEVFDLEEKMPHNPHFFAHLQERMEEKPKERVVFATLRPVLLASLLVFNIVTAISFLSDSGITSQEITEQDPYELFANDFNLNQSQTDLFNIQ